MRPARFERATGCLEGSQSSRISSAWLRGFVGRLRGLPQRSRKLVSPIAAANSSSCESLMQVRVDLRRHGRRGVAELPRDDQQRHPAAERERGRGVPESMERDERLGRLRLSLPPVRGKRLGRCRFGSRRREACPISTRSRYWPGRAGAEWLSPTPGPDEAVRRRPRRRSPASSKYAPSSSASSRADGDAAGLPDSSGCV